MTPTAQGARRGGFSLLELAVSLAVIGIVAAGAMEVVTAFSANQNRKITRERIAAVREALVLHAAREGFLPCPGDATMSNDGSARFQGSDPDDQEDCDGGRNIVGVPWEDLGIPREIAFDAWGRRLTYAVFDGSSGVTRPNGLDMRGREGDPASVQAFLVGNGLEVRTAASDANSAFHDPANGTGAAFVIISHGANADGAYGRAGFVGGVPGSRDDEDENDTPGNDIFVKTRLNESGGNAHFDDFVSAMRIDEVAKAASLYLPE